LFYILYSVINTFSFNLIFSRIDSYSLFNSLILLTERQHSFENRVKTNHFRRKLRDEFRSPFVRFQMKKEIANCRTTRIWGNQICSKLIFFKTLYDLNKTVSLNDWFNKASSLPRLEDFVDFELEVSFKI
jgi:hypothetical protein